MPTHELNSHGQAISTPGTQTEQLSPDKDGLTQSLPPGMDFHLPFYMEESPSYPAEPRASSYPTSSRHIPDSFLVETPEQAEGNRNTAGTNDTSPATESLFLI